MQPIRELRTASNDRRSDSHRIFIAWGRTLAEYPLFIPPADLAVRPRTGWSAAEASRYREWLVDVLPARTDALCRFLGIASGKESASEFIAVGETAMIAIRAPEFSLEASTGRQLTNRGYALAADIGLFIAQRLLQHHPTRLRWETVRRPKRDMSFNLPVLVGFASSVYLEPVGGSVAEAHAVLRGTRGPDAWERVFTFWSARADG